MKLKNVDLNLLLLLDAIHRSGNLTQAANSLGMTQSAASNALTRLRRTFGDPLFVRTPRGMTPTSYSSELARPVREALQVLQESFDRHSAFNPKDCDQTFVLRLTDMGEMIFLPKIIASVHEDAPAARIKTMQVSLADLPRALEIGEIDAAIGYLTEISAGVSSATLLEDRYVCIARKDHPVLSKKSLTLAAMKELDHLIIRSAISDPLGKPYREQGLLERCVLSVHHFASAPQIVRQSNLIAIVPERLVQVMSLETELRTMTVPFAVPELSLRLIWHKRLDRDPVNKWLRQTILKRRCDS